MVQRAGRIARLDPNNKDKVGKVIQILSGSLSNLTYMINSTWTKRVITKWPWVILAWKKSIQDPW